MAKRKSTPARRLRVVQTCPAGRRGDEVYDDGSRAFERWLRLGVLEEVADAEVPGSGSDEDPPSVPGDPDDVDHDAEHGDGGDGQPGF